MKNTTHMTETQQKKLTQNLKVLADAYKAEFAEFIYTDERFTDLVMDLAGLFVMKNCPAVDEDVEMDLALMLLETVAVKSY